MLTRLTLRLASVVVAVAAVTAVAVPTAASGAPIDDKRAQAAALEAQINGIASKLGALNEQINDAQVELDAANATIADADAKVDAAKARTNELKQIVADRAVSLYMRSGSDSAVDDLDTRRVQDLIAQQKYASLAAERDRDAMGQLKKSQEDLMARKADAEQARAAAAVKKSQVEDARTEMAAGEQKLQAMKNSVDGEIADLVKQAEAERVARQEAANRERLAQAAPTTTTVPKATPVVPAVSDGATNTSPSDAPSPSPPSPQAPPPSPQAPTSGGVAAVMAYAYAQLGKPYCYGGAGPGCFDCSGLTMMAWAQAGVYMPHGSNAQLAMFPRVSMSQLQVGDLVYWTDHVGIYVGGGQVLHAPHTGTVVQIATIWSGVIGANRPG